MFIFYIGLNLGAIHMRWAGPAKLADSSRWSDFYPTFIWNLQPHLFWSDGFDHVVFKRF